MRSAKVFHLAIIVIFLAHAPLVASGQNIHPIVNLLQESKLYYSAALVTTGGNRLFLLHKTKQKLDQVLAEHPSDKAAVSILLGENVEGIDVSDLNERLANNDGKTEKGAVTMSASELAQIASDLYARAATSEEADRRGFLLSTSQIIEAIPLQHPGSDEAVALMLGEPVAGLDPKELSRKISEFRSTPKPEPTKSVPQIQDIDPQATNEVKQTDQTTDGVGEMHASQETSTNQRIANPIDPEAEEATLNLSRSDRREIQRRLTLLGLNTRGVDGIFGPGTRRAIAQWQQNNHQKATGFVDQDQKALLGHQTNQAYAKWKKEKAVKEAEERKKQKSTASQKQTNSRYRDADGCMRESDGSIVPNQGFKCDLKGAFRGIGKIFE